METPAYITISKAIANADIEVLQILLPAAKEELDSHHVFLALKQAIQNCINGTFSVCLTQLSKMLQLLDENGIENLIDNEELGFVLQTVQDLVQFNRRAKLNEDDTVIDICFLLCRLFHLNPADTYHRALRNIPCSDRAVPSKELIKELFILRGWPCRHLKKR